MERGSRGQFGSGLSPHHATPYFVLATAGFHCSETRAAYRILAQRKCRVKPQNLLTGEANRDILHTFPLAGRTNHTSSSAFSCDGR